MKKIISVLFLALCLSVHAFSLSIPEAEKMIESFFLNGLYVKIEDCNFNGYLNDDWKIGKQSGTEYIYKANVGYIDISNNYLKIGVADAYEIIDLNVYDISLDKNYNIICKKK